MAGGPIFPSSIDYDLALGEVYPNVHSTPVNAWATEGIGVIASLASDRDIQLEFQTPTDVPTGTAKLVCDAISTGGSGTVVVNPRWKSWGTGEDTDVAKSTFPTAEGDTTLTWTITTDDDFIEQAKIDLVADTIVAGERIHMYITFDSTSTLDAVSTWSFYIVWEDA